MIDHCGGAGESTKRTHAWEAQKRTEESRVIDIPTATC